MTSRFLSRRGVVAAAGIGALIVALAFFTAPNQVPADDDGDPWTGRWLINGVSAQDTEYSGSLTIVDSGIAYELQWLVTGDIAVGTGRLIGDRLEATWRSTSSIGGEAVGTATYRLSADGAIAGTRTIDGVAGAGSEEGEPAG